MFDERGRPAVLRARLALAAQSRHARPPGDGQRETRRGGRLGSGRCGRSAVTTPAIRARNADRSLARLASPLLGHHPIIRGRGWGAAPGQIAQPCKPSPSPPPRCCSLSAARPSCAGGGQGKCVAAIPAQAATRKRSMIPRRKSVTADAVSVRSGAANGASFKPRPARRFRGAEGLADGGARRNPVGNAGRSARKDRRRGAGRGAPAAKAFSRNVPRNHRPNRGRTRWDRG